jgi:hypothetical protein
VSPDLPWWATALLVGALWELTRTQAAAVIFGATSAMALVAAFVRMAMEAAARDDDETFGYSDLAAARRDWRAAQAALPWGAAGSLFGSRAGTWALLALGTAAGARSVTAGLAHKWALALALGTLAFAILHVGQRGVRACHAVRKAEAADREREAADRKAEERTREAAGREPPA